MASPTPKIMAQILTRVQSSPPNANRLPRAEGAYKDLAMDYISPPHNPYTASGNTATLVFIMTQLTRRREHFTPPERGCLGPRVYLFPLLFPPQKERPTGCAPSGLGRERAARKDPRGRGEKRRQGKERGRRLALEKPPRVLARLRRGLGYFNGE